MKKCDLHFDEICFYILLYHAYCLPSTIYKNIIMYQNCNVLLFFIFFSIYRYINIPSTGSKENIMIYASYFEFE